MCCRRLPRAHCCIFSCSTNIWGKYEDTWSCFWATNTDKLLPKCIPSVSLSAFPHFLFSLPFSLLSSGSFHQTHTLCFSVIFFVPFLFHLPLWASSLPPVSNWPTLYELQLKMMSLIIWVEIMWLSFPLCVSAGPCVHAHISLCVRAHSIVYVMVHCIDAHINIFRQEWKTSMWAICWLNCWPTVVFTDRGPT